MFASIPLVPTGPVPPGVVGVVGANAAVAGATAFVPLSPSRLADTRAEQGSYGFSRIGATTIRVQVAGLGGVPADASAAVLNLTSVGAWAAGFATVFPAGNPMPATSTLNVDRGGQIIANLVTVRLGTDGAVDIFTNVPMDLVVDVAGAYRPTAVSVSAGRLVTLAGGAQRVFDSRNTGGPIGAGTEQVVSLAAIGMPADAIAVVLTIIATEAMPGYWSAYPAMEARPRSSSLNIDTVGQTRSALAIVRLAPGTQAVSIFAQTGGHLIVDVAGWYSGASATPSTDGLFVPISPVRVFDTRGAHSIPPWGGSTFEVPTGSPLPTQTSAVAANITLTDPLYTGYITAYPAGSPRPFASNLNATGFDQTIANHAIVRVGDRGLALFTQSGTHLVADITGWFTGRPEPSLLPVPRNPSYATTAATAVSAPGAGVGAFVGYERNIDTVVNSGRAGIWAGTGRLGTREHNIFFAHRTSYGGVFRNIDQLRVGSRFEMVGSDGRTFLYEVVRQEVIVPRAEVLIKMVHTAAPITVTLVACHPPGSVRYRLAVTGRLIGLAG